VLVECQGLRVDRAGATLLEGFELKLEANSLALVGEVESLFEVMSARAQVVAGRFEIDGQEARVAVVSGRVGLVLAGQQRSPRWTTLEFLTKSALLAGLDASSTGGRARAALDRIGLASLAGRRLGMLSRVELTAVELAAALQTDPALLVLQAPFRGLDAVASDWLWQVVERGARDRQLVVSFDAPLVDQRARLQQFEQLALVRSRQLVATGPPAELLVPHAYLVSVTRGGKRLASALEASAFEVSAAKL